MCEDHLDQAEIRISGAENDVNVLKVQLQKLETSVKELTERTEMAESRSRRSNLRIIKSRGRGRLCLSGNLATGGSRAGYKTAPLPVDN